MITTNRALKVAFNAVTTTFKRDDGQN